MNSDTGNKKNLPGKRQLRKAKKTKKKNIVKTVLRLLGILSAGTAIAAVLIYFLVIRESSHTVPAPIEIEDLQEALVEERPAENKNEDLGADIIDHIITAGSEVDKSYKSRPESHELTEQNTADFATIESCLLESDTGRIVVTATGDGIPISDDKYYYLFALNTYDTEITENDEYIAKEYKDSTTVMRAALNYNRANSRLFKKFAVAVKKDGKYVQVSTPKYITNPEAIAIYFRISAARFHKRTSCRSQQIKRQ